MLLNQNSLKINEILQIFGKFVFFHFTPEKWKSVFADVGLE